MTAWNSRYVSILVEQLADDGTAWRSFTYYAHPARVADKLDSIRRAYNGRHTRVTVLPQ